MELDLLADSAFACGLPVGQRATGRAHDLERPRDAGGVGWRKHCRAGSIFLFKRGMGLRHRHRAHRCAYRRGDRGHRGDSVEQRAQIKTGAANEDRQAPGGVGRIDFLSRRR